MQIQTINRADAEKVFIVVENNQGAVLTPGQIVEWSATTSANYGRYVELIDSAYSALSGIGGHKVAGAVESTIATSDFGRLQVYGPATVRATSTVAAGIMAVATTGGSVTTATASTDSAINAAAAIVGWSLEASANATQSVVQLSCL